MIVAKFKYSEEKREISLSVNGHADSAEYGRDLICSSASVLAYTLAQNISDLEQAGSKIETEISLNEGKSDITCRAKDKETYKEVRSRFLTIMTGYMLLAHEYKLNVCVEVNE